MKLNTIEPILFPIIFFFGRWQNAVQPIDANKNYCVFYHRNRISMYITCIQTTIRFFLWSKDRNVWECMVKRIWYWHIISGRNSNDWFTWCQTMRNNNIVLFLTLWLQTFLRGNNRNSQWCVRVLMQIVVSLNIIFRLRKLNEIGS